MTTKRILKFSLCLISWLSFLSSAAHSEPIGVAFYALQAFSANQCELALSSFRAVKVPFVSVLWGTFGDDTTCLKRYLDEHRESRHLLEIYLSNPTCKRAGRHCSHRDGLGADFEPQIFAVKTFLEDNVNSNTEILLAIGLEDDYTNETAKDKEAIIRRIFADSIPYVLVRNRNGNGSDPRFGHNHMLIELHSTTASFEKPRNCIWSNDGQDVDFGSRRRPHRDALSVSSLLSAVQRYKRSGCKVSIWWNNQAAEQFSTLPYRRHIRLYRKDINVVNRILRTN